MEVSKKLKIHGKWINATIKKSKNRRSLSSTLSYGHLRIVCGEYFNDYRIIETLESIYSPKKI